MSNLSRLYIDIGKGPYVYIKKKFIVSKKKNVTKKMPKNLTVLFLKLIGVCIAFDQQPLLVQMIKLMRTINVHNG